VRHWLAGRRVVVGEPVEQIRADRVGLHQLAVVVEQRQPGTVGGRGGGADHVEQQRAADPAGDGGVDLGDEGGLVLDELRAAAIPVQAEAAPAATVGHERAAQLVADPTRPQQLA
jgi:hypothetical protein